LSIPLFRRHYFLTLVGGEEKRSAERRAHERHQYPLRRLVHFFFFLGIGALIYVIVLFVLALQSPGGGT
jgi:hypothetical protein